MSYRLFVFSNLNQKYTQKQFSAILSDVRIEKRLKTFNMFTDNTKMYFIKIINL